jgi:hypothetical protein
VIGRHKFSVGKKFWNWKCSTFNNDIFGTFSVRGNFSWMEMGPNRILIDWNFRENPQNKLFPSKCSLYILSVKVHVFLHLIGRERITWKSQTSTVSRQQFWAVIAVSSGLSGDITFIHWWIIKSSSYKAKIRKLFVPFDTKTEGRGAYNYQRGQNRAFTTHLKMAYESTDYFPIYQLFFNFYLVLFDWKDRIIRIKGPPIRRI